MQHQQQLVDLFTQHQSWEDRYRTILRLGKAQPRLDSEKQLDDVLLAGCESKVWFYGQYDQSTGLIVLAIDSDSKKIRGLISIIINAHQSLNHQQVQAFDCVDFFERLGLLTHLSPSRGNGIRAIITAIKELPAMSPS